MTLSHFSLPSPTVRTIDDLRAVLCYPSVVHNIALYFMYRDVARNETDRTWIQSHSVRYDITVITPANFDSEYVKTKGHYHPEDPTGTGYPELYEVVEGIAHFLLQTKTFDDIVIIEAQTGDIIAIPQGYGNVMINPSPDGTLIMEISYLRHSPVSMHFMTKYTGLPTMNWSLERS